MANPILKGTRTPQQQWWDIDFTPTQGSRFNTEYRGIDITQMGSLAQSLWRAGYSGKLKFDKGVASLTASSTATVAGVPGFTSPAQDIVDKWEVGVDQERPEIFSNEYFISLFAAANTYTGVRVDTQCAVAIRKFSGNTDGWKSVLETVVHDGNGDPIVLGGVGLIYTIKDFITGTELTALHLFYQDYAAGRTAFAHGKYVLRHTTSMPNTYSANVADFNVEKIYSIAQLLTECQNGNLWILPLPPYLAYKIATYPVPAYMNPNYVWGALKMRSNAVLVARERIEITTEYLIDAIALHTYGLAT